MREIFESGFAVSGFAASRLVVSGLGGAGVWFLVGSRAAVLSRGFSAPAASWAVGVGGAVPAFVLAAAGFGRGASAPPASWAGGVGGGVPAFVLAAAGIGRGASPLPAS